MEQRELTATLRTEKGSNACRRLRRQGIVPGVVYGRDMEPAALQMEARELNAVLGLHGEARHLVILRVQRDGGEERLTTLVKELQRDSITGAPLNVDFQRVSLTEKVTTTVPVVTEGTPVGVREGGILDQVVHEVEVSCLPQDIPEQMVVDISHLKINDLIHVRELQPPLDVEILADPEAVLAVVHPPRIVEEEAPPEEELEAAEEPEVIQAKGKREEEEGETAEES